MSRVRKQLKLIQPFRQALLFEEEAFIKVATKLETLRCGCGVTEFELKENIANNTIQLLTEVN